MSAVSLLERNPDPSKTEIREAISGNVCRCTGYLAIIEAIREASGAVHERNDPVASDTLLKTPVKR